MTTLSNITNQMRNLEIEISRQQKYISKHGESNDSLEFDEQWEQYKEDAQYNLHKWDSLKKIRDEEKSKGFKESDFFYSSFEKVNREYNNEFMKRFNI